MSGGADLFQSTSRRAMLAKAYSISTMDFSTYLDNLAYSILTYTQYQAIKHIDGIRRKHNEPNCRCLDEQFVEYYNAMVERTFRRVAKAYSISTMDFRAFLRQYKLLAPNIYSVLDPSPSFKDVKLSFQA